MNFSLFAAWGNKSDGWYMPLSITMTLGVSYSSCVKSLKLLHENVLVRAMLIPVAEFMCSVGPWNRDNRWPTFLLFLFLPNNVYLHILYDSSSPPHHSMGLLTLVPCVILKSTPYYWVKEYRMAMNLITHELTKTKSTLIFPIVFISLHMIILTVGQIILTIGSHFFSFNMTSKRWMPNPCAAWHQKGNRCHNHSFSHGLRHFIWLQYAGRYFS